MSRINIFYEINDFKSIQNFLSFCFTIKAESGAFAISGEIANPMLKFLGFGVQENAKHCKLCLAS